MVIWRLTAAVFSSPVQTDIDYDLKRERKVTRKHLRPDTRRAKREEKFIEKDLHGIGAFLHQANTPETRRKVQGKFQDIQSHDRILMHRLESIRKAARRIEETDTGIVQRLKELPRAQRVEFRGRIKKALAKLPLDYDLQKLQRSAKAYEQYFERLMEKAVQDLKAGRRNEAAITIEKGVEMEKGLKTILRKMKQLEKEMMANAK